MKWSERLGFSRSKSGKVKTDGKFIKCKSCSGTIYKKQLEESFGVCPDCEFYLPLRPEHRVSQLLDKDSFEEFDADMKSGDPLNFSADAPYKEKYASSVERAGVNDAFTYGVGKLDEQPVVLGIMNFAFMGGSMGSVLGEKVTRAAEKATELGCGLIIISASGGARMQEGALSLMQMAKSSAALARHRDKGLPFISILTNPTMGGVSASFATLGDVIMAEPNALIGFAGPRVIEQTFKKTLPEGFQKSEFLLEHGHIDMIVGRPEMKETLSRLLKYMSAKTSA